MLVREDFQQAYAKAYWRLCCVSVHKAKNSKNSETVMALSFSKLNCKSLFLIYFMFLPSDSFHLENITGYSGLNMICNKS